MQIYHNPRCRKSRETLALIKDAGVDPQIIEYLIDPPTAKELSEILNMLNMEPQELLRKGEAIFKEKFKGKELDREGWIDAMISHPKMIERPIVVKNGKAIVGRPPENVQSLL
jgi:arsenate reductase